MLRHGGRGCTETRQAFPIDNFYPRPHACPDAHTNACRFSRTSMQMREQTRGHPHAETRTWYRQFGQERFQKHKASQFSVLRPTQPCTQARSDRCSHSPREDTQQSNDSYCTSQQERYTAMITQNFSQCGPLWRFRFKP